MRPVSDEDHAQLTSVVRASSRVWDPKILDSEIAVEGDDWYDPDDITTTRYLYYPFVEMGAYRCCKVTTMQNISNPDYEFFEYQTTSSTEDDKFFDCFKTT